MKNCSLKIEIPMPAAMPCKTLVNCRGETCRSIGNHKTKCACIVEADKTMRIRLEGVPHRHHEDHISAKGISHWTITILYTSLFRCLKHEKFRMRGRQWKNKKNWRKYRHGSWQVRNKKEVIEQAMNKGRKVHLTSWMDLCHIKNSELEPQFQKI